MVEKDEMNVLEGETCAFCNKKTLTLSEVERDIPFFGKVFIFSMDCNNCNYHKADVEAVDKHPPSKQAIEVDSEEDMKIRVIKSSKATIKFGRLGGIEPGSSSNGYVTNIEGLLNRMKKQAENIRDEADDKSDRKKAKNVVKKLTRIMWGQEKLKITMEDPEGNSAIISDKTVKL
ncbi:hypothetical protein CMO90_03890 [Candidatus Woesearchaeota archaeon]|jgi:zinc finger protein|nr:hypothetical protein [Candidatus Woesearchaeota archaeon]|tara:strand:+ start:868 stop:1392 length:525 start_codon:yes stop_codon:yes gene_type:complete